MFRENRLPTFFASMFMLGAMTSSAHAYLTTANGAVADGVTDDTYNLQLALTYCSDNDLVCEIPAGKTHYVTGPLFIWGGATLKSSNGGGLKIDDTAGNQLMINVGISGKDNGDGTHLEEKFSGAIRDVVFTMAGSSSTPSLALGRILYFWRTDGATIEDNTFNLGNYYFSPTSSGNDNAWVVNGSSEGLCEPNCRLIRKNITIEGNRVVANADAGSFEGIAINGFDTATIKDNVVTGTGDDPIAIHFSKNVLVESNLLRSVDGRIFVSSSSSVDIIDNTHIRIPSRLNGLVSQGHGLIHMGFEHAGSSTHKANTGINIEGNRLYYPAGSNDVVGAITLYGARDTTISDNIIVNDQSTTSYYAMYISPQAFTYYDDPDPSGLDDGTFGGAYYARVHDLTIEGNVSGSTVGVGAALKFDMEGQCLGHEGPISLTGNTAPEFRRIFSVYDGDCVRPWVVVSAVTDNTIGATTYVDTDSDGWPDMFDNCPVAANADQFDLDGNGVGDICQNGLTGHYINSLDVDEDPTLSRIDSAVDFNWDWDSPAPGFIDDGDFSVLWTGRVVAPVAGEYVFCTTSDDGVILSLNGIEAFDFWEPQAVMQHCAAPMNLTAGQSLPIVLKFFDTIEEAIVKLTWAHPGQSAQTPIPTSALYAR